MQTQPRPTPTEDTNPPETTPPPAASPQPRRTAAKSLNLGLAAAGLVLYILYLTKGADFYSHLPGGRKLLFPVAGLAFVGLAAARLYIGIGRQGLAAAPGRVWQRVGVREWTPVALIFLLALALRLWGINFGLPNLEQVDEWAVADRALHIVQTGNFDPLDYRNPALPDTDRQAFTYPTLYTYLETGVFAARFLQGVAADKYEAVANITAATVKPDFYLWGRALTALLGALTAVLVYVVGRRFYGRKVGLVAALFMAFFYLNVQNSHFITTDVPSGFFALLPFLFIWPILQGRDNWKLYGAAGLLAGLAVATKYNNALIMLPIVAAHLLGRPPRRWLNWNIGLAMVGLLAGFVASAPFIIFHLPNFLTDVAEIVNHYQNLGHAGYQGDNNWLYYLQAIGYENLAILGLAIVGIIIAFARHKGRDLVLLSFPLVSYLQLSSYKVNFTRNLMPILPFLAIFGGLALVLLFEGFFKFTKERFSNKLRLQNLAIGGLAALAIAGPTFSIISYDSYNARPTTRALALDWATDNLPRGAKLWLEPGSLEYLPPNQYQSGGGDSVLAHPFDWYRANDYNYVVLSEATYKNLYLKGDPGYKSLVDGPLPANFKLVKSFQRDANQPGPTIIILSTGLAVVAASPTAFNIQKPLDIPLGQIKLIGLDTAAETKAGSKLPIVLYWQTLAPLQTNYTVFIHLLDDKNQIISQLDIMPLANTRPTKLWKTGEVLRDPYTLPLPAKLAPGNYHLHVGLYDASNGARLKTLAGPNELDLGDIKVV